MSASPATDAMLPDALRTALRDAQAQVNTLVLGKPQQVRLAFVALLADGHLLIEDLPGLGKTTLAHAMATTVVKILSIRSSRAPRVRTGASVSSTF